MNPAIIGKLNGKTLLGHFTFHDTGKLSLVVNGVEFSKEVGEPPECLSGSWEIEAEGYNYQFEEAERTLIKQARFVFRAKN